MTTHQSITQDPANWEKCHGCHADLPPHQPRLYQVRIPEREGQHQHSFWCDACQRKALKEGRAA